MIIHIFFKKTIMLRNPRRLNLSRLIEKQQAQVFIEDTLSALVYGILRFRTVQQIDEKEAQERQSRILSLCYLVLNKVEYRENAWSLAPDIMNILVTGGSSETVDTITGLKAVYLKGFSKQQKPPPYPTHNAARAG
jgi:hypothetical protein